MLKHILTIIVSAMLLAACGNGNNEETLKERATELCQYIPDHELLEQ